MTLSPPQPVVTRVADAGKRYHLARLFRHTHDARDTPADPTTVRQSTTLCVLLTITVLLALIRSRSYHQPPNWDIGTYVTLAQEMRHGERLYADMWDVKPPAIFATYAAATWLTRDWAAALFVLSMTAAVVTMLGVYRAAAGVSGTAAAGLWAAGFWAAMCFDPLTDADAPNTEVFMNGAIAWGFALWVTRERDEGGRAWARWILISLLFAVGSLYKHVAAIPAMTLAALELLRPPTGETRRYVLLRITVMGAIALSTWGLMIGYFAATGRGWIIVQTLFVFPRTYGGSQFQNIVDSVMGRGFRNFPLSPLPALAMAVIGLAMLRRSQPMAVARWLALAVGVHLAVALPGQFFDHYYQLWYVPLAIGAGWGAAALPRVKQLGSRWMAPAASALALLAVAWTTISWLPLDGDERARRRHGDFFMWAVDAARDADRMLLPGETFYVWSDEGQMYAVAERRLPGVAIWKLHTTQGVLVDWLTRRTIEALEREKPELFIHFGTPLWPEGHPLLEWSQAHYDPLPGENRAHFPLFFHVRKGGALANRLGMPTTTAPAGASATQGQEHENGN